MCQHARVHAHWMVSTATETQSPTINFPFIEFSRGCRLGSETAEPKPSSARSARQCLPGSRAGIPALGKVGVPPGELRTAQCHRCTRAGGMQGQSQGQAVLKSLWSQERITGHNCQAGRFARLWLGVFFPNWKFMEAIMESSGNWQHRNTLWEGPLVRQRTWQGTKHRN